MLFDDIFYPGNPERRRQVALLQGSITAKMQHFHTSWNENADMLNGIFAQQSDPEWQIQIKKLECKFDTNCVDDCIKEINSVITDTDHKLSKLVDDIGLNAQLPANWKDDLDPSTTSATVARILGGALSVAASAYVTFYVYTGVRIFTALINYAGAAISETASFLGGAFAGAVLGAAAFVITDAIASAITGAIERKQLREAIDALTEFQTKVADPIEQAAIKVDGVLQAIKDGVYKLDDDHLLVKQKDGSYIIITIGANHTEQSKQAFTLNYVAPEHINAMAANHSNAA